MRQNSYREDKSMYIKTIQIRNFRILSDSTLNFKDNLCLLIGRNNSGKTSFFVLFERFMNNLSFDFNDFSLCKRKEILNINAETIETDLAIQLILNIEYEEQDNLCHLSEFIMDLDSTRKDVNILFECIIKKEELLEAMKDTKKISKEKFIRKYLNEYLEKNIYTFNSLEDLEIENRIRLVKKDIKDVKKLIDFEIIHAKRSVSSSEEKSGNKVLSRLATNYFNNLNQNSPDKFEKINSLIDIMDSELDSNYELFFNDFLDNAKNFLGLDTLRVVSNLKAQEILSDSSEVVYGINTSTEQLPEYLNGLGYMNILYLLLNIEIKKNNFIKNNKDIKLLFIEEPEAHTHPQLQYIFSRKINDIIDDMPGVQSIITTHSPQIVSNHPFTNIRYMLSEKDKNGYINIKILNLYEDLRDKYKDEEQQFKFLNQYLSLESAELFFADKVIFIEGVTENMLMPYFITKYDKQELIKEKCYLEKHPSEKPSYIPISSQNVSILQVGANAKAFKHFFEILKITTLIITDIDTTKATMTEKGIKYKAEAVQDSPDNISNATIKYFLSAPSIEDKKNFQDWLKKLISGSLSNPTDYIYIAYQKEEKEYHARSFEDAFINVNYDEIKDRCEEIKGLKNIEEFNTNLNIYDLTSKVIDKKSDFASSLLFIAHVENVDWTIPSYIREGLKWLQKN